MAPSWWTSSCTHKVLQACACMCPSERLVGSSRLSLLLHGGWEQQFYSVWLLKNGRCNWPCTRSLSSLEAGQGEALTIFFSLGVYLAEKRYKEACQALVAVLKMSPMAPLCARMCCDWAMCIFSINTSKEKRSHSSLAPAHTYLKCYSVIGWTGWGRFGFENTCGLRVD